MKWIKLGIRYNLVHLVLLVLFTLIREVILIIISKYYKFQYSLIYCQLMFSAELIFGSVFLLIYSKLQSQRRKETELYKGKIRLLKAENSLNRPKMTVVVMILIIFMGSYFDFESFIIPTYALPKYTKNIMNSLNIRIKPLFIIFTALIYHFALNTEFFRHQKLSLIIILINFIIMMIFEFLFQYYYIEKNIIELIHGFVLIIVENIFLSFHVNSAKYLMDIQYISQYKFLFLEGIFGLITSISVSLISGNYKELKNIKDEDVNIIIILFILYFILSGLKNIFAYTTIKLYSPIVYAMSDLMYAPILISYHYIMINEKSKFIIHFIINIILSIINLFFSCVYNELFILNFCKLEYFTYPVVSSRAILNVLDESDITKHLPSADSINI